MTGQVAENVPGADGLNPGAIPADASRVRSAVEPKATVTRQPATLDSAEIVANGTEFHPGTSRTSQGIPETGPIPNTAKHGHDAAPGTAALFPHSKRFDQSKRHWLKLTGAIRIPTSAFDADAEVNLRRSRVRWWVWIMLGIIMSWIGQTAAWWLFRGGDHGFTGAILFTLCALAGYVYPLFQRNSKEIWTGTLPPLVANALLVRDLAALFSGVMLGFASVLMLCGTDQYQQLFSGAGGLIDIRRLVRTDFAFAQFQEVLLHNVRIMLLFLLVGLLFRYTGILLIVVLNAAHWGVVLAAGTISATPFTGICLAISVVPHLAVEMTAYVFVAMAGVFLSRAFLRYRLLSQHFSQVGAASLNLVLMGTTGVIIAAVLEWGIAGMLGRLTLGGGFQVVP